MIPLQITLRNFLGYDDNEGEPYSYDFRDHRLWSISGDNGAGKSAIFDVVTYTLFGCHRGGRSRDEELLRKGATEMSCSFAFEHGGRPYRVTRTLKKRTRRSGEVVHERAGQLDWYDPKADAWREVPDTGTVTTIEGHISRVLLGFGYETFVSSFLLIQGDSDRLISSAPRDRFAHLSGILDLRQYKRLEERAGNRAKALGEQHQVLAETLREVGIPSQEEVTRAQKYADDQELAAANAQAELRAAEDRVQRIQAYHDDTKRRSDLAEKAREMGSAQANADEIRAAAEEQTTLDQVLPRLRDARKALDRAESADKQAREAEDEIAELDVDVLATALREQQEKHVKATKAHATNVTRLREKRRKLRSLEPEAKRARRLKELEADVRSARVAVRRLEKEIDGLSKARSKLTRLESLNRSSLLMKSYSQARRQEAEALKWFGARSPETLVSELRSTREDAESLLEDLRRTVSEEQTKLGHSQGELEVAQRVLHVREEASSEGTCSRCGQTISEQDMKREIAAVRSEVRDLKAAVREASNKVRSHQAELVDVEAELSKLKSAEDHAMTKVRRLEDARARLTELAGEHAMAELPEDCRMVLEGPVERIDAGLKSFQQELTELPEARSLVEGLVKTEDEMRLQKTMLAKCEKEINRLLSTVTREQARADIATSRKLERELASLEEREGELQDAAAATEAELASARESHTEALRKHNDLRTTAKVEAKAAEGYRAASTNSLRRVHKRFLPPAKEKIAEVEKRLGELVDAKQMLALLQESEKELDTLRGRIKELDDTIANVVEEDRVPVDDGEEIVDIARTAAKVAQDEARHARELATTVSKDRKDRLKLQKQAEQLARSSKTWDRLTKLLGRGGLQLALMKRDLAEIEALSNVMLARISGGQLQLAIECTSRRNVEEIVFRCVDGASADDPLDVVFLSGGQKFRVAVALAVGIGQCVGLGGAMPSQIIDEGFGSLDETGRIEMLDAIREMSPHFERIIVVSHTESFHDPALFPARYELRKEGRKTLVSASL